MRLARRLLLPVLLVAVAAGAQAQAPAVDKAVADGSLVITGKAEVFQQFLGLLDAFPFWFPIVTP